MRSARPRPVSEVTNGWCAAPTAGVGPDGTNGRYGTSARQWTAASAVSDRLIAAEEVSWNSDNTVTVADYFGAAGR